MKDVGSPPQLESTKKLLKDLQSSSKDISQHESKVKLLEGVKMFLENMKLMHQLFDQSQSSLRDAMFQGLKELPKKYQDSGTYILMDIQKYANTSLESLRKKRELEDDILI